MDDPALVLRRSPRADPWCVDLPVLIWIAFGAPISWRKGLVTNDRHTWIGVDFETLPGGVVRISLPE
eukprot:5651135-Alexandrium_andersonii.AAC.1